MWAFGCIFYEMLAGHSLFDASKDYLFSIDQTHMSKIVKYLGPMPE